MEFKMNVSGGICVFLFLTCVFEAQSAAVFDVTKFGAVAGSGKDISNAILSAWKAACTSTSPSTVVIPQGVYLSEQVKLSGPCGAAIEFQLQGTLRAPPRYSVDGWVSFGYIDQFTLSGGGTFDGQGQSALSSSDGWNNNLDTGLAISLRFDYIKNGVVRYVKSLNSKNFHANVFGCQNLKFDHFTAIAPGNSINTDGIHIGRSTGINITDSTFSTGDDCISIGDGATQVRITRITCGPGHGISVGSLGLYPNEQPVSGIFVTNSNLSNTDNGVRIKSWPGAYVSSASDIHFQDINMQNVANPIIIDQTYCPNHRCDPQTASNVRISNVSFKNIQGTSSSQVAVKLDCSSTLPCQQIEMSNINLQYSGGAAASQCSNVKPIVTGPCNPGC